MRFLLPTLLLAVSLHLSPAQETDKHEPTPEGAAAAKRLLETMDMEATLKDSLSSVYDAQMAQFAKMGMSQEGIVKLKKEMLDFTLEIMPWSELEPEMIRVYASYFTAAELDELNKFYQSETGKKAAKLMPQLMEEGMQLGQQRVQAHVGELQQRIAPIIQEEMEKQQQLQPQPQPQPQQ